MADHLTVDNSSGQATAADDGTAKQVDQGRAELERLRGIAKERHGKPLDDRTLEAIIARRKAKLAHESKVEESKAGFEAKQSRESVTAKATDPQARAQRAAGSAETRGAD